MPCGSPVHCRQASHGQGFVWLHPLSTEWTEQPALFSLLSALRKAKMFSSTDAELQELNYRNLIFSRLHFYSEKG